MNDRSKSALWFVAGVIMFIPAAHFPQMVDLQLQAWMFVVDLPKPNPVLLFGSFYYWPCLIILTGWYWVWRFMRWIFDDEGPLPRFFKLLVVLWAPAWLIPSILLISLVGWFICFYKAYHIHIGPDKEETNVTALTITSRS